MDELKGFNSNRISYTSRDERKFNEIKNKFPELMASIENLNSMIEKVKAENHTLEQNLSEYVNNRNI